MRSPPINPIKILSLDADLTLFKYVGAFDNHNNWRDAIPLEDIMASFQVAPESVPRARSFFGNAFCVHSKWESVDRDRRLACSQGGFCQNVNFLDVWVGHCLTTNRNAVAMDHQITASSVVRLIVGIRKTKIKGQVIVAVWVE